VYGTFVKMSKPKENADHYLEIGFYDKAGSLKPGESVELKVGFAKNGWTKYNQFNDYSYNRVNNRFITGSYYGLFVRKAGIRKGTVRHPLVQDKENLHFERILYGALYFKCGGFAPTFEQKKE